MDNAFGGADITISNFKNSNYLSSFGNVYKINYALNVNIYGMSINMKQTIYNFYIDQYTISLAVTDNGDTANIQKTAETVLNSFYIQ